MRLTRISLTDFKRHAQPRHRAGGRADHHPRPQRGRQVDHPRGAPAGALPEGRFQPRGRARRAALGRRRAAARGPRARGRRPQGPPRQALRRAARRGRALTDGETIRDFALIQEHIAELTGVPSEAFFRATASVGHAELADVAGATSRPSRTGSRRPSAAPTGAPARAKRKLDAAIHRYRTEGQKNPGLLKAAARGDRRARGRAGDRRAEPGAPRGRPGPVRRGPRAPRRRSTSQLARQQADLAEARRAEALATQRDEAQARYDLLEARCRARRRGRRLTQEMPTDMPLTTLRTTVSRATNLSFELSELEADLGAGEASLADAAEAPPPRPAPCGSPSPVGSSPPRGWPGSSWAMGSAAWPRVGLTLAALVGARPGPATGAPAPSAWPRHAAGSGRRGHARQEADLEQQERLRRKRRELEALLDRSAWRTSGPPQALLADRRAAHRPAGPHRGRAARAWAWRTATSGASRRPATTAADDTEQARHALAGMGELGRGPRRAGDRCSSGWWSRRCPPGTAPAPRRTRRSGRVDANLVDAELVAGLAERCAAARAREAELVAPPAHLRGHSAGHRGRRAGHPEDRGALPRGAHGPGRRAHHRRPLPRGPGRRAEPGLHACEHPETGSSSTSGSSRRAPPTSSSWPLDSASCAS